VLAGSSMTAALVGSCIATWRHLLGSSTTMGVSEMHHPAVLYDG
jgi:hypothetical protein